MAQENHIVDDPYKYYLEEYKVAENIEPEKVVVYDADPVWLNEQYARIIEEARRVKSPWVVNAMKNDPAFIVDPVNDYYLKFIPQNVREALSEEQLYTVLELFDPLIWAERNLLSKHGGFKARTSRDGYPYQAQMIRCKSKRISVRAGRRIGKTVAMVIRILHRAFTWTSENNQPVFDIVIFTPNQSQIEMIFKMFEVFIDNNPKLMAMIPSNTIPTRKNPYHILELSNGVSIHGFVSGSTAIRGQRADMLVIDECAFLDSNDTDAVVALLAEHKNVEFWVSSTPQATKDYFYERCFDPNYVSFHFPTNKYHPDWGPDMEREFRTQLTELGYQTEVLAEFPSGGFGVFQPQYVAAAFNNDYTYGGNPQPGWYYGIGVDWNDPTNGTQIYVVGYDSVNMRYRVVDKAAVHIEGWTQLTAVSTIRDLNRKWRCSVLYVDYGHGSTQVELLHEIGMKAPPRSVDRRLVKAKSINFSSSFVVYDPWQRKEIKKPAKPYLVNNAVRVFEQMLIDIPSEDVILKRQLETYTIDRITASGLPIYKSDSKFGDHALDALMLALLGFNLEYSTLGKPLYATNIGIATKLGYVPPSSNMYQKTEIDIALERDKMKEKEEYERANHSTATLPINQNTSLKTRRAEMARFDFFRRKRQPPKRKKF